MATIEDLLKSKEDWKEKKGVLDLVGDLGNRVSSIQSVGEILRGQKQEGFRPSGLGSRAMGEDPLEAAMGEQKLADFKMAQDKLVKQKETEDPASAISTQARLVYQSVGGLKPTDTEGMSAAQLQSTFGPVAKLREQNIGREEKSKDRDSKSMLASNLINSRSALAQARSAGDAGPDGGKFPIAGFSLVEGAKPTAKDAETVKAAEISRRNIEPIVSELKQLVDVHGTEAMPGPVRARMEQLRTSLNLQLKTLEQLGALAGPDLQILNEMNPDPTNPFQTNASVMDRLDKFKAYIGDKVKNESEVRGYKRTASAETPEMSRQERAKQILEQRRASKVAGR